MLEQQFIQWTGGVIAPTIAEIPIPVTEEIPIQFFTYNAEDCLARVDLITADGTIIKKNVTTRVMTGYEREEATNYYHDTLANIASLVAPMECFRLQIVEYYEDMEDTNPLILAHSNLLRYTPNDDGYLSSLQYYCNEQEFGFPFAQKSAVKYGAQVALPILLSAAQYTQTDKIYESRNGEQIVLYATINKEYEGETDYIPESWHEKIVTALSCDEVYINGERVTKSDSYEIDQDNYTYTDCGIRLTRATFKVKTNVVKRNSNC